MKHFRPLSFSRFLRAGLVASNLLVGLFVPEPLAAQAADRSTNAPAQSIQVRLTAFQLPESGIRFALRERNEEGEILWRSSEFDIPTNAFGRPVGVESRNFELGAVGKDGSEQEGGAFRPLLRVDLPDNGDAFLILLVPAGTGEKLEPRIVRADDPDFAAGEMQFFNLGESPVGWDMAGERGLLPPGERRRVRTPEPVEGRRSFPVGFFQRGDNGELRPFSETRWVPAPGVRTFVFFAQDPETRRFRYRMIEESPHWLE